MSKRPKYLNLFQIRLPLPGIMSIMHRASGAVLFLALPVLLCWLQQSLSSPGTFAALQSTFSYGFTKLVLIGLMWGFLHHLCAGIRHLMLDLDCGTELKTAHLTSLLVFAVSITLTVVAGALLW
jgi:succinate dehydrogenase / fumarate reductase, cytochrome b subunit